MAKKKMAEPSLIVLTEEKEQDKATSEYPLLDIMKLLEEHEKTITMVFQPQKYRIMLKTPPGADIVAVRQKYISDLEKVQGQEEACKALLERRAKGEELSAQEQETLTYFQTQTLPYTLELLCLCIVEPSMTVPQLQAWILSLASNQIESLFQKATELVKSPSHQEETELKN